MKDLERSAGIILAVSSLPSRYGIGTFGRAAYDFVDFLVKAGQKYWQMLPLGPTGYGDSPYQSFSAFAGNPYYIDLDMLVEDGLLGQGEPSSINWGSDSEKVDYGRIYANRFEILKLAKERGWKRDSAKIDAFCSENGFWLDDYCLYMACKRYFGMKSWNNWPDDALRSREPDTLQRYREKLREDIELFTFIQYLFFQQWNSLKSYMVKKKLKVIGDIPIYVAYDSADVWTGREWFLLDEQGQPIDVSGVPPDAFTPDGQLWGNPLYDWNAMEKDGFGWWIRRIAGSSKLFDIIRFDHFRGLDEYWAVSRSEKTAKNGEWRKGPGMKLIRVLNDWFINASFIAEDLGYLTSSVKEMVRESGWPGMKILEFAFDSSEPSSYLPHNYDTDCICYTGTHDNMSVQEWFESADKKDVLLAKRYLGLNDEEGYTEGILRAGMGSVARLFIAQMQDYLGQGAGYRMNTPGSERGNWQYRVRAELLTDTLAEKIYQKSKLYGRVQCDTE